MFWFKEESKITLCGRQALFRLLCLGVCVCLNSAVAHCSCDFWFLGTGDINP